MVLRLITDIGWLIYRIKTSGMSVAWLLDVSFSHSRLILLKLYVTHLQVTLMHCTCVYPSPTSWSPASTIAYWQPIWLIIGREIPLCGRMFRTPSINIFILHIWSRICRMLQLSAVVLQHVSILNVVWMMHVVFSLWCSLQKLVPSGKLDSRRAVRAFLQR